MIKTDKHIDIGSFDVDIKELAAHENSELVAQRLQQAMLEVLDKLSKPKTELTALATGGAESTTISTNATPIPIAMSGGSGSTTSEGATSAAGTVSSAGSGSGAMTAVSEKTSAVTLEASQSNSDATVGNPPMTSQDTITSTAMSEDKDTLIAAINAKYLEKESEGYNPDKVAYWQDVITQLENGADPKTLIEQPEHIELKKVYNEVIAKSKVSKFLDKEALTARMIKEIETKYTSNEKLDPAKKRYWDSILYQLNTEELEKILAEHEELFLFAYLLLPDLDTLGGSALDTLGLKKVYISFKKMYPDTISSDDIYPKLGRLKDKSAGKGKSVSRVTKDKKGVKHLKDDEITFTANLANDNINWNIYKKDGTLISTYVDKGKEFKFKFTEYGEFVIEAYGNSAVYKKGKYSKAKDGKGNYIAIHIKEPELEHITVDGIKNKGHIAHDAEKEYTFTAVVDILSEKAPRLDVSWKQIYKATKKGEAQEQKITNTIGTAYTTKFANAGYYEIVATAGKTSVSYNFILGGNYITRIKEKNTKTRILYNQNNSLAFMPASYKLKGSAIEGDKIRWWVKKGKKRIGEVYTGKSFMVAQTKGIAEGVYRIVACVDDAVFGKKYATTEVAIVHPMVTDTYWCDENKEPKVLSGLRGETSHICGKITDFGKRSIDLEIYQDNKVVYMLKKAGITQDDGTFMVCVSINDVLGKSKSTAPLTYKIKGSDYVLKNQENLCSSSLKLTEKAEVKEAYFMYGSQILSPIKQAVPYGTKIKIVVETTNMIGQELELELYKAKNTDDHSYSKSSIRKKDNVVINSDGKAIVAFELQKDWAKDHKSHKYFYVGAESDTFGSYFTKEHHSHMLLAYQDGDKLDSEVEVVGSKSKADDYEIGILSEKWESGGRGPGTISSGKGDPGGASYGVYQLSSKRGTLDVFLNNEGKKWKSELIAFPAGSKDFNKVWKHIAETKSSEFRDAQHQFIKRTHYLPYLKRVKNQTGLDIDNYSNVLKDVLWSTSVQHGASNNIFRNAFKGKSINDLSEEDIIIGVYDERGKTKSNGKLKYFRSVSEKWVPGLKGRFRDEKSLALKMLKNN